MSLYEHSEENIMLKYTSEQVIEAFKAARNVNAAAKKYIKNEGDSDPKGMRVIKKLREAFESKNPLVAENFIKMHLKDYEMQILTVIKYAYAEYVTALSQQIVERYSDDFNKTFEMKDDEVVVNDTTTFNRIVSEVFAIIENTLKEVSVPNSPVMKNIIIYTIFDPAVAEYITAE
jgi:hypothetical protein